MQGNKNPFKPIVQQCFMNSQQALERLDASNPVNLLILFKAYAKIFPGYYKGRTQEEITHKLISEV